MWKRFLRLLKFGVVSSESFAITFNKFYISTCILKFLINGEIFKSIALAVLEIVKTLSVALEVSLSIMYVSREATFSLTNFSFSKNE